MEINEAREAIERPQDRDNRCEECDAKSPNNPLVILFLPLPLLLSSNKPLKADDPEANQQYPGRLEETLFAGKF